MLKGLGPDEAWAMRTDISLMYLVSRIKLMERAREKEDRRTQGAESRPSVRADGRRVVPVRGGYEALRGLAKQLQGSTGKKDV